jgi:hypothetical protein
MQLFPYIVPAVCSVLLGAIATILWRRRDHVNHPLFFAFCVFDSVAGIALLFLQHWSQYWYFYSYWAVEVLSSFLLILCIQELANSGKKQLPRFAKLVTIGFYMVGTGAIMVAVWTAGRNEAEEFYRIMAGIIALDHGLRLLQSSLLLFVIGLFMRFSLTWTHTARGVAIGAAVLASGELLVATMRLLGGKALDDFFFYLRPTSFLVGCAVWLYLLLGKQREHWTMDEAVQMPDMNRVRTSLERLWN